MEVLLTVSILWAAQMLTALSLFEMREGAMFVCIACIICALILDTVAVSFIVAAGG